MNKTIILIVSPEGNSRIETKGFVGSSCRDASRFLEQALGAQVSETLTSEFHQQQTTEQTQRTGL